MKACVSVGILWLCLKNTGIVAWSRRFYRKKSSRLEMNSNNVYRGGLNPNPFAGFSPPQYTLYKFIVARLLLFCENQQIHILTPFPGIRMSRYLGVWCYPPYGRGGVTELTQSAASRAQGPRNIYVDTYTHSSSDISSRTSRLSA